MTPRRYFKRTKFDNVRTGGAFGIETKFFDQNVGQFRVPFKVADYTNVALSPPAVPFDAECINCPKRGNGPDQREGRKVRNVSIDVNGTVGVYIPISFPATPSSFVIRLLLVRDNQANGTRAALTEILADGGDSDRNQVRSFPNLENEARFDIVRDFRMNIDAKVTGYENKHFSIKYKCPAGEHTSFTGNDGLVTSVIGPAYNLYAIALPSDVADGDQASALDFNDTELTVSATSRFRFRG